ncbi:MAG TPA: hypothetical protein VMN37_01615 [Gemmatimonadales bacterium]|nr:hypothetical protein [Gemmatimonadales bacterium]
MISYEAYKVLHLLSIMLLFLSFGGLALYVAAGGTRESNPNRKLVAALHGTAAFLVLLGGFGLLARLGVMGGGFPLWVWIKLAIWLVLSFAVVLPYRRPALARPLFLLYPVLGGLAAWAATYKPG